MTAGAREGRRRPENTAWFLALIAILVAAFVVWAILSLRIDLFTEAMKREEPIAVLWVVDDGDSPLLTEVLFLHPSTRNGALVSIPAETGMLLSAVDRVDRLESVYDPKDRTMYREAVEKLLGTPVDFEIRLSADLFEKLVDHLGGIDLFIPNAVDDRVDGVRYLFPPGGVRLDGAKARSYLEYRPEGEIVVERTDREHRLMQAVLKGLQENHARLTSEAVFPFITDLVDSDMDDQSLSSFLTAISGMDPDRFVLQGILGNRRDLDGTAVLFPYYDGNLVRETVQRVRDSIRRSRELGEDGLTVRVEVLNGTDVTGLASRTAQIFRSYGFRVVGISNADSDSYERTVVLDRSGNPEASRRVAELIRCEQVHAQIEENRDETVDVTVILGKDFDVRYVKE